MNERTRSRPSRADRPARSFGRDVRADGLAILIAIASVLLIGIVLLSGPARLSATSPWPTRRTTTSASSSASSTDGARMPFAVVGLRSTREFSDVIDQGATWVFRFRAQGQDGGALTVTRAELKAAGWQVTVPESVATQLQSLGIPASPCVSADCPARTG